MITTCFALIRLVAWYWADSISWKFLVHPKSIKKPCYMVQLRMFPSHLRWPDSRESIRRFARIGPDSRESFRGARTDPHFCESRFGLKEKNHLK